MGPQAARRVLIQKSLVYIEGMMLFFWTQHSFICITLADDDSSRLEKLSFTAGSRLHNVREREKNRGENQQRDLEAVKVLDSSKVCGFDLIFSGAQTGQDRKQTISTKLHIPSEKLKMKMKKSGLTLRKLLPKHHGCGSHHICIFTQQGSHVDMVPIQCSSFIH